MKTGPLEDEVTFWILSRVRTLPARQGTSSPSWKVCLTDTSTGKTGNQGARQYVNRVLVPSLVSTTCGWKKWG